jgi:hypothetical protein
MNNIKESFERYASGFDCYGDNWQDKGADEYYAAGYRQALEDLLKVARKKVRTLSYDANSESFSPEVYLTDGEFIEMDDLEFIIKELSDE